MERGVLEENMLDAWIGARGMLKNSKITKSMTYNEAMVMKIVYDQYRQDGVGRTAVSTIVRRTNMLKSLVNRTINALCQRGCLRRERGEEDGRNLFVYPVEERLGEFLSVHQQSLTLARRIVDVIGEEDAAAFVRMVEKLEQTGLEI